MVKRATIILVMYVFMNRVWYTDSLYYKKEVK